MVNHKGMVRNDISFLPLFEAWWDEVELVGIYFIPFHLIPSNTLFFFPPNLVFWDEGNLLFRKQWNEDFPHIFVKYLNDGNMVILFHP
jgi:hypothetical protein